MTPADGRTAGPRPLADLVAPDWAVALEPVAPTVAAVGDFLRAEIAAGRGYLPSGDRVLRAFSRPLGRRPGADRGAGPVPHAGASGRSVVLGGTVGTADPAQPDQHLRRAADRSRHRAGPARRPERLVRAGCAAAQPGAHRGARSVRVAPRQGLGAGHPARHRGPGRARRPAGRHPVGSRRAESGADAGRRPVRGRPRTPRRCRPAPASSARARSAGPTSCWSARAASRSTGACRPDPGTLRRLREPSGAAHSPSADRDCRIGAARDEESASMDGKCHAQSGPGSGIPIRG